MAELGFLTPQDWNFWDTWMRAQRLLTRELDRSLQRALGVSKAEFSVLVTLEAAADGRMRVGELATALDWDKGRVAHQLTRMESRGLLTRQESGVSRRRTGVELTMTGREIARQAIRQHSDNIRRLALARLTGEERTAISNWSARLIEDLDAD